MNIPKYPQGYHLRLTSKDYKKLKKDSETAGLSCSNYLRKLINNQDIKPKPPETYAKLAWEISKIGNNINQIAYKANSAGKATQNQAETAVFLVKKCMDILRDMR